MKTNAVIFFSVLAFRPKPTSKEWKHNSILFLHPQVQSPKPTSKEWKPVGLVNFDTNRFTSEAYLEGMKTNVRYNLLKIHKTSEAYLEGMKTSHQTQCHSSYLVCPKPTSKEWKPKVCLRRLCVLLQSEAYLEGMKTKSTRRTSSLSNRSEAYLEGMKTHIQKKRYQICQ